MDYDALRLGRGYAEARRMEPNALALWRDAICWALPARDVRLVLDVGAGTGCFAPGLADLVGARVLAVEPSLGMLGQRDRAPGAPVAFAAADAQALPVRDGLVDLAFLSMVYHHLGWPGVALAELGRVLRPGGWMPTRAGVVAAFQDQGGTPRVAATRR